MRKITYIEHSSSKSEEFEYFFVLHHMECIPFFFVPFSQWWFCYPNSQS